MSWYAIHDDNGKLMSVGTVVAEPLAPGLQKVPIGDTGPDDTVIWDEAQRKFISEPAMVDPERQEAQDLIKKTWGNADLLQAVKWLVKRELKRG